jgi:hypothetical protein
MNAKEVAVHEVDGRRMHMVVDGLAEGAAAPGLEPDHLGPVGAPGHLPPRRSHAHRRAAALLSVYRSRVDFLRHREIDSGTENPLYRFKKSPVLIGRDSYHRLEQSP